MLSNLKGVYKRYMSLYSKDVSLRSLLLSCHIVVLSFDAKRKHVLLAVKLRFK